MPSSDDSQSDLIYFTHIIDKRRFGGWYRLLPDGCIEVMAIGLIQTPRLDGHRAEDVACRVLEEFIRERERLGQPVPIIPHLLEPVESTPACPSSPAPTH